MGKYSFDRSRKTLKQSNRPKKDNRREEGKKKRNIQTPIIILQVQIPYLRGLPAAGKDAWQHRLLQKIEAGLRVDAAKVRDRIVAAERERGGERERERERERVTQKQK